MTTHADVLVLGGGLIGLCVARELAGRGLRVELLDARTTGAGASSAGAGLLAPISDWRSTGVFVEICRRARDDWRRFRDELVAESGREVEYDGGGAILVACDDDDGHALDRERAIAAEAGEEWTELELSEVRRWVPDLAPTVLRAALLPGEHRVDNVAACAALADVCRRRQVRIREGFPVDRVTATRQGVVVEGRGVTLAGAALVVAGGAWSGNIAGLPPLPVHPVRGQMLRLVEAAWPWRGSLRWRGRYVVRRGADGLLVGATIEEAGFDARPTLAGIRELLGFAGELFPALARAPLDSVWAGLRPGSPDGRPLLGRLDERPLFLACGHYRNGILLAPWTGGEIAAALVDGRQIEQAALFAPDRFAAARG